MQVQKQQLESEMEQYRLVPNWERSTIRLYIVCLFNLYAEYIMQNARLDESLAEIKIAGRNINNIRYADDPTLMAESEEELKSLLRKVKEESEKASLELSFQKIKILASSPITSWQTDREKVETVADFIFLGSRITAVDGDYSLEIKRYLLLRKKAMTNLDSILKNRDITLLTMVHLVKAMIFPVVMYGCESWTIKKADCRRIDALNCGAGENSTSPLDSKKIKPVNHKGNQPWTFIGRTNAEAPVLWPPVVKNQFIEKDPDAGKDWRKAGGEVGNRG